MEFLKTYTALFIELIKAVSTNLLAFLVMALIGVTAYQTYVIREKDEIIEAQKDEMFGDYKQFTDALFSTRREKDSIHILLLNCRDKNQN